MMSIEVIPAAAETKTQCGCSQSAAESAKEKSEKCCSSKKPERREPGPDRREEKKVDRRTGIQRRQLTRAESGYAGPERRGSDERRTGLERRRGPGRRLSDDRKAAEEGEMTGEQFEFVMAIQTYKKVNKRLYPTWTEILEIVRQLGYRKVMKRIITLDVPEPGLFEK